jgi:uncharacterized protein
MGWLMAELKVRKLFFVDSRTSANTKALQMAERIQLPSRKRDVFLDDLREESAIRTQLMTAIKLAKKQGTALAIGHPYAATIAVLRELPEILAEHQVTLVSASALMQGFTSGAPLKSASCMAPPPWLWPEIKVPINPFLLQSITNPLQL